MYFKLMQKIVALITALIATIIPVKPVEGIDPTLPLMNVNPNEIAEAVEAVSQSDINALTDEYYEKYNNLQRFSICIHN